MFRLLQPALVGISVLADAKITHSSRKAGGRGHDLVLVGLLAVSA
ncbi:MULTISPECIES: hypothetical protein [Mesorhizobium]|nr:hypothetical protein [Mesorhizobium sp.]